MIAEVKNPSLQLANSTEGTMNQSRLILFFLFIFFLVTPARGQETIDIAAIYSIISRLFVKKYQHTDNFGVATALGYDAVMVLADAIRRAGSTDRTKIRDALANTRFYKGITGTITFI